VFGANTAVQAGASAFLGANFPTGEFNSGTDIGWSLGGYYTYDALPIVEVGGLIAYNDFSVENLDNFTAWEIQALGQANILFLRGFLGLGVANYSNIYDAGDSGRKTKFAWQAGVAMKFLMLEGRLGYHLIDFGEGSANWVNLSAGVVF
jgi:hypothetical protein